MPASVVYALSASALCCIDEFAPPPAADLCTRTFPLPTEDVMLFSVIHPKLIDAVSGDGISLSNEQQQLVEINSQFRAAPRRAPCMTVDDEGEERVSPATRLAPVSTRSSPLTCSARPSSSLSTSRC